MTQLNIKSIFYYMQQYIGSYADCVDEMPEYTREGWEPDIKNLKDHAYWFAETPDLRIILGYLLSLPNHELMPYIDSYVFDHYDEEEADDCRKLIGFALDSDWPKNTKTYADVELELEWVDINHTTWIEQRSSPRNEYIASK